MSTCAVPSVFVSNRLPRSMKTRMGPAVRISYAPPMSSQRRLARRHAGSGLAPLFRFSNFRHDARRGYWFLRRRAARPGPTSGLAAAGSAPRGRGWHAEVAPLKARQLFLGSVGQPCFRLLPTTEDVPPFRVGASTPAHAGASAVSPMWQPQVLEPPRASPHPARRVPVPPRHRRRPPAPHLQHVAITGSTGISLIDRFAPQLRLYASRFVSRSSMRL